MAMTPTACLTCLKYSQRNSDWKEEPQRTISTQKLCRIYKAFEKIHYLWQILNEQWEDDFATVKDLKSQDARDF